MSQTSKLHAPTIAQEAWVLFQGQPRRPQDRPVLFALRSQNSQVSSRSFQEKPPVQLASLMLYLSVERRCSVMKSKKIRLFQLGTALLVLSGMLSLQGCFFYDGGGHEHHWHHWHHGHHDDR